MQQILVYADSLSWGIIPATRRRLAFGDRWPGVMERTLCERGVPVRVLEDCLNGRRTVFEDPFRPGRNGLAGLAEKIEMHSPLALVLLMLGTNDFQSSHANTPWHAAQGIAALVRCIRQAPVEPGMPVPPILVVVPPSIGVPRGAMAPKFAGADARSIGLARAYREVCEEIDCACFDSGTIIRASAIDGIHLDADQHRILGLALAQETARRIDACDPISVT